MLRLAPRPTSSSDAPVTRRWRLELLAGLVLALACRPVPTSPERSLRVATYNIAAGHGNLDGTAEAIAALRADVIALQEVDVYWEARSAWEDQASRLGARLGMAVRFAPIYTVEPRAPGLPSRQFGVALLSRHPIVAFTNRPLTRWSTLEPASQPKPLPGLLDATVRAHGLDVRVLNTHLDYRAEPAVRTQQVVELLAALETSSQPTVLLGDLNAPPDAPELAPLFARLTDVWGDCTTCGFSYPADAPSRRIDHVLVSPNVRVRRVWVAGTRASDHRPVVADLVLPVSERAASR